MKQHIGIAGVYSQEILDSRGNPTIETEIYLDDGSMGRAAVPSGASTGSFEAKELRDGDKDRYFGKGVLGAVANVNGEIARAISGANAMDQPRIDGLLADLDGTEDKSRLGANAILSVSLACARAAADSLQMPLYNYIGGVNAKVLPVPMMNVLNGGAHAGNSVDIQEFMIVPVSAGTFREAVRMCSEVFHTLKTIVPPCGVGDEGGYAPDLESDAEALEVLLEAVEKAGYAPGRDIMFALDAASSEWYDAASGTYTLPKRNIKLDRGELLSFWTELSGRYPVISLEDGMAENDWDGWKKLTDSLGGAMQLVGDDLFVTNTERICRGIEEKTANSVLIKVNQIGTLTETLDAVSTAERAGYTAVISHRSGETEDTTIADIAVALNAGQIKTGAPSRTDRTAKYNRLLRIEDELMGQGIYPGSGAFYNLK